MERGSLSQKTAVYSTPRAARAQRILRVVARCGEAARGVGRPRRRISSYTPTYDTTYPPRYTYTCTPKGRVYEIEGERTRSPAAHLGRASAVAPTQSLASGARALFLAHHPSLTRSSSMHGVHPLLVLYRLARAGQEARVPSLHERKASKAVLKECGLCLSASQAKPNGQSRKGRVTWRSYETVRARQ